MSGSRLLERMFYRLMRAAGRSIAKASRAAKQQPKRAASRVTVSPPPRPKPVPPPRPQPSRYAADDVAWSQWFDPPEEYRIEYADRFGEYSERVVHLSKIGERHGHTYLGVFEGGKFKTLRADRVLAAERLSTHAQPPAITGSPGYPTPLPPWPVSEAVFKVPTIVGTRHWTVNLNAYTCTCPEKRVRSSAGAKPGTLGWVCPHMATAILANLPEDSGWDPKILAFLGDPRKTSIAATL